MKFNTKFLAIAALALATYAGAAQATSLELSLVGGVEEQKAATQKCKDEYDKAYNACRAKHGRDVLKDELNKCFDRADADFKSCKARAAEARDH